ncbi:saccharopine dehydrogenase [Rubrivivax pictus]|uniref:Saccharopine dehydrogenase n=2 Tax=Pseudaquabacterium pictum TaxID=2315236 RepID=A0A480ANG5_9BURK|nr:saccharopine dehydrogenase [Rubrivivax pictus]
MCDHGRMHNPALPVDVVLFGATGFTGRLVAEVLLARAQAGAGFRWALAGRSAERLAAVRQAIGAPATLPLLTADATDPAALASLVRQTRLVITTVGPYTRHGTALATACAEAGTDYVDLCGEPLWMAQMIRKLQAPAATSGARIVFSCGFDSVPFDLGVLFLQTEAQQRFGQPLQRVQGRVQRLRGGLSGGTAASMLATLEAIDGNPAAARLLADPFALTPGWHGPVQPDGGGAHQDRPGGAWSGPFVMAMINTKNVHRSNALRGHPWGRDFAYDERLVTGRGLGGRVAAELLAGGTRLQNLALAWSPARALIGRLALPQPGQGPSRRQREAGSYDLLFTGQTVDGRSLAATVHGDRDPGYGSTSRMLAEAALCLLQDVPRQATPGGVWTPGAAMGLALLRRLQAHAGLRFVLKD